MAEKKRNWLGILTLLLLLVLIPVLSYLWMKAGYDYQVDARAELHDLGPVPAFPEQTIFGDTLTGKKMGNQIQVLGYFDPEDPQILAVAGKHLGEIHEQFDQVDWFRMELWVPEQSISALQEYMADKGMKDAQQVFYYKADQAPEQINQTLHIGQDLQGQVNVVALADTNNTIVNYYNLADGKQFVRLVEHIAMLRPQEKEEKKALFQREREL